MAWFALVPLFAALPELKSARALFWAAWIFGLVWNYANLFWLNTLTIFNPFIPAAGVLAAVSQAGYLLWFVFPAAWALRRLPPIIAPLAIAAMWTGMEYLRGFGPIAFPWNDLAHSQVGSAFQPVIQGADLAGVYGVSFLIALCNAALAVAVRGIRAKDTRWPIAAGLNLVIVIGVAFAFAARTPSHVTAGRNLRVAIVQANISQLDKWAVYSETITDDKRQEMEVAMFRKTVGLARSISDEKPDLVVLPETAFTTPWFVYDTELHSELHKLARELNADVFFGADNREPQKDYFEKLRHGIRPPSPYEIPYKLVLPGLTTKKNDRGETVPAEQGDMAVFNSAWQITAQAGLADRVYNKIQLVPFGETAPFVDKIPLFQEKIMMVGSFQAGLEYTTFETSGVRYGVMICFESAFAPLAANIAKSGAEMICVLTNDAWYDPRYLIEAGGFWSLVMRLPWINVLASSGPRQHFAESVFRAVETRLPVVRAANSGISAVLDPSGRIVKMLPWDQSGAFAADIAVAAHPLTFYVRHGDWFAQICLLVLIIGAACRIIAWWKRKRQARLSAA